MFAKPKADHKVRRYLPGSYVVCKPPELPQDRLA